MDVFAIGGHFVIVAMIGLILIRQDWKQTKGRALARLVVIILLLVLPYAAFVPLFVQEKAPRLASQVLLGWTRLNGTILEMIFFSKFWESAETLSKKGLQIIVLFLYIAGLSQQLGGVIIFAKQLSEAIVRKVIFQSASAVLHSIVAIGCSLAAWKTSPKFRLCYLALALGYGAAIGSSIGFIWISDEYLALLCFVLLLLALSGRFFRCANKTDPDMIGLARVIETSSIPTVSEGKTQAAYNDWAWDP
ncbi:hypothetical protein PSPO01_04907 [Paraphaeosphaeria sporulosa]